jgi:hypothetical protein
MKKMFFVLGLGLLALSCRTTPPSPRTPPPAVVTPAPQPYCPPVSETGRIVVPPTPDWMTPDWARPPK